MQKTILLIALALVPLSGCLGFGDDDAQNETPLECPTTDDQIDVESGDEAMEPVDESLVNTTLLATEEADDGAEGNHTVDDDACPDVPVTPAHNDAPIPGLTMTAADGTVLGNGTAILMGETITFSAANSTDDGTIDLIGLTVVDNNGTRNVQLFENGAFVDATLTFNHAGLVNVTMSVLDDAGGRAELNTIGYVNSQETGANTVPLFDPVATGCNPSLHNDSAGIIGNQFRIKDTVNVQANVNWISVEATGVRAVTICSPDGEALASGDSSAMTEDDAASTMDPDAEYFVALYPSGPETEVTWTTTLHYEPA